MPRSFQRLNTRSTLQRFLYIHFPFRTVPADSPSEEANVVFWFDADLELALGQAFQSVLALAVPHGTVYALGGLGVSSQEWALAPALAERRTLLRVRLPVVAGVEPTLRPAFVNDRRDSPPVQPLTVVPGVVTPVRDDHLGRQWSLLHDRREIGRVALVSGGYGNGEGDVVSGVRHQVDLVSVDPFLSPGALALCFSPQPASGSLTGSRLGLELVSIIVESTATSFPRSGMCSARLSVVFFACTSSSNSGSLPN